MDFDRTRCSQTTVEIKSALQNSMNLPLICIFCFRRERVGDTLLQNTAAAPSLVSSCHNRIVPPALEARGTRPQSLMALSFPRGTDSCCFSLCPFGRLQNGGGGVDFAAGIRELTACVNVILGFAHSEIVLLKLL